MGRRSKDVRRPFDDRHAEPFVDFVAFTGWRKTKRGMSRNEFDA
jgi:hypothetical protein